MAGQHLRYVSKTTKATTASFDGPSSVSQGLHSSWLAGCGKRFVVRRFFEGSQLETEDQSHLGNRKT
jgi:hypothetical protein